MADNLAERVYALVSGDQTPLDGAGEGILDELNQFEIDLRDRGFLYGLAWAMARAQDPFETEESVTLRAQEATRLVWQRWNGVGSVVRPEAVA